MDTIINDLKEAPDVEVLTLKGASNGAYQHVSLRRQQTFPL